MHRNGNRKPQATSASPPASVRQTGRCQLAGWPKDLH